MKLHVTMNRAFWRRRNGSHRVIISQAPREGTVFKGSGTFQGWLAAGERKWWRQAQSGRRIAKREAL